MQQMSGDIGQSLYPQKTQTLESCADLSALCFLTEHSVCRHWKNSLRYWPWCVQSTTRFARIYGLWCSECLCRIGKVKPLNKLRSKKEYQRTSQQLGENWLMPEDLLMQLEAFVCDIYGAKNVVSDVNQCKYSVFCAKKDNNSNNNNNYNCNLMKFANRRHLAICIILGN